MPLSRIELDAVWSTQRRRTAIIVQSDSVGSAGGTIAISQRLTGDELLERATVERFALRRRDRCIRADIGKVSGVENQPEQPSHLAQVGTVLFIVPMNDHKIVGRDDEGELAAVTQGEKRPRRQFDHRDDEIVDEADPPKIPVAPVSSLEAYQTPALGARCTAK